MKKITKIKDSKSEMKLRQLRHKPEQGGTQQNSRRSQKSVTSQMKGSQGCESTPYYKEKYSIIYR